MSESKSVWVLVERGEDRIEGASLETLSRGRQLADDIGGRVVVVVVGAEDSGLAGELASYGADEVWFLDSSRPLENSTDYYVQILSGLVRNEAPDIFLCGATLTGRELATRLAARLGVGLVSDCIDLAVNPDGRLTATKLTHGGMISSAIIFSKPGTQMATIKPGVMTIARPDATRRAEVRIITPEPGKEQERVRLKGVAKADPDKLGLDEADVIVAGGKGVVSRENFRLLEELAGRLGGVVAGSLGAVDEGWLPRKKLVGQTGTTVAPRLYVACGISGSLYHVLGMRESGFVIAVNKDRNAPIFKVADMSIIGDAAGVISAVIAKLPGEAGESKQNSEAGNAGEV